jgi:hypothetical protein
MTEQGFNRPGTGPSPTDRPREWCRQERLCGMSPVRWTLDAWIGTCPAGPTRSILMSLGPFGNGDGMAEPLVTGAIIAADGIVKCKTAKRTPLFTILELSFQA